MSTVDTTQIWLKTAETTHFCGLSLGSTLYRFPVDILLQGPLGAGKTTFLQGFGKALGIDEHLTSPTYALEQQYKTDSNIPFIHIDLYRLTPHQAKELILQTDTHEGIRCIEWAERLGTVSSEAIHIQLEEQNEGRSATIQFDDIKIPSQSEIDQWRIDVHLPSHIIEHCNVVADMSLRIADTLVQRGQIVRKNALQAAAFSHDLLRFVDFKPNATPNGIVHTEEQQQLWSPIRKQYPNMTHEQACSEFLRTRGYPEIASIVEVHGLTLPSPTRATIEQKILYYADKRVLGTDIVSLDERFDDFTKRYGQNIESPQGTLWRNEAKSTEKELFPDGISL